MIDEAFNQLFINLKSLWISVHVDKKDGQLLSCLNQLIRLKEAVKSISYWFVLTHSIEFNLF